MNEKSLQLLEFNKIKNSLTSYASSELGRTMCENIEPLIDINKIQIALNETDAALSRIRLFNTISFVANNNLKNSIRRLQIQSYLSLSELYNILKMLNNIKNVKTYSHKLENDDCLSDYFNSLDNLSSLFNALNIAIYDENDLNDAASHTLSSIRTDIRHCKNKIQNQLNSLISTYSSYLMEQVIVLRNNNYCIPVKAEYKNKINGIVHDQSNGGLTYFIEPITIVNLNNEIRSLKIKETEEINKITMELSTLCFSYVDILTNNLEVLTKLDFIFAKAKYANAIHGELPNINDKKIIDLKSAIHPLLDRSVAVPIDIKIGDTYKQLIITGPNTGGKTVSLKTVGLLCVMAQSGLFIPAFYSSNIPVFEDIFVDIGDEQSIEQNLSTFSGHIKRIAYILRHANSNSLCLFDEIGAGTDPIEGAALATSILEELLKNNITTFATTHYSEIKEYAINTKNVENASLEFDIDTLMPTYKILLGIAGKSNAFAISKKLGIPNAIIANARTKMDKDAIAFDKLLSKLEIEQKEVEKLKNELLIEKNNIDKIKSKISNDEKRLNEQKYKLIKKAKKEALEILEQAKLTADESIKNINKIAATAGIGSLLEEQRTKLRNSIKSNEIQENLQANVKKSNKKIDKINIGDKVFIHSMNIEASVSSEPNEKNLVYVNIGALKTQVKLNDISLIQSASSIEKELNKTNKKMYNRNFNKSMTISTEINVIGLNVSDACEKLDKYLDDAMLSHLSQVRIIHGRGTGALQKGIHNYLKTKSFIKEFSLADFNDGGEAITVVTF